MVRDYKAKVDKIMSKAESIEWSGVLDTAIKVREAYDLLVKAPEVAKVEKPWRDARDLYIDRIEIIESRLAANHEPTLKELDEDLRYYPR